MPSPVENTDFEFWEQQLSAQPPADRTATINFMLATKYFAYAIGPQRNLFPDPTALISRKRDLLVSSGIVLARNIYIQDPLQAQESVAQILEDHDFSIFKIYLATKEPKHIYPISATFGDEFFDYINDQLTTTGPNLTVDVFSTAIGQIILGNSTLWQQTFESEKIGP